MKTLNSKQAAFVAAYIANGGNASSAARDVDYHPEHGRRLVAENPAIQAAIAGAREKTESRMRDWSEIAIKAQARLSALLDSEEEVIRLRAAQDVLDRALGKATTKIESEFTVAEQPVLDEVSLRAMLNLIAQRGMNSLQAIEWVQQHPEEVRAWGKRLGVSGSDAVDSL